ncbi:MAG: hypothetical protein ACJ768_10845 [Gaiellaceae bacterium]|jgi:hypothetical protein
MAAATDTELTLTFEFSVDQTRALVDLAQHGMLAAANQGGSPAANPVAKAALATLSSALEDAETSASVREELEQLGFQTDHLSDAEVAALGRRIADIPHSKR